MKRKLALPLAVLGLFAVGNLAAEGTALRAEVLVVIDCDAEMEVVETDIHGWGAVVGPNFSAVRMGRQSARVDSMRGIAEQISGVRFLFGDNGDVELFFPSMTDTALSGVRTVVDEVFPLPTGYAQVVISSVAAEVELPTDDSTMSVEVNLQGEDPEQLLFDLLFEAVQIATKRFEPAGPMEGRVIVTDLSLEAVE